MATSLSSGGSETRGCNSGRGGLSALFAGAVDLSVDFADFLIVSRHFGRNDATRTQGDFDGDGDVDFTDFLTLAENFGRVLAQLSIATSSQLTDFERISLTQEEAVDLAVGEFTSGEDAGLRSDGSKASNPGAIG